MIKSPTLMKTIWADEKIQHSVMDSSNKSRPKVKVSGFREDEEKKVRQ